MEYEVVVGLEVHAQLATRTKMFCGCPVRFGERPNSLVCPICLGLPGVLPVVNESAYHMSLRTAVALGCELASFTKFDRKNYYYPDLPKNYQVSQYDLPFAEGGTVPISTPGGEKLIRLVRVHMEEDAGKLVHTPLGSLVDLNRAGTPLMEIVSEPDLSSPEEARSYLEELKRMLEYLEVCDCNMEEGSLRCDANLSVRPVGQKELGVKTEIKNMNSFSGVEKALTYEAGRQIRTLEAGGVIEQATLLWHEDREETSVMRTKEHAHDYRYFPEPDLSPIVLDVQKVDQIREELPELPRIRWQRFQADYDLSEYDAEVLIRDRALADYFEDLAGRVGQGKLAANWVTNQVSAVLNERKIPVAECPVSSNRLSELLLRVDSGDLSKGMAGKVFDSMLGSDAPLDQLVEKLGGGQISDPDTLRPLVEEVFEEQAKIVEDIRGGKDKAKNALFGKVMGKTRGRGNPEVVRGLIEELLASGS